MREVTTIEKVYTFDELSDGAKENARNWYRVDAFDCDWYEFVYDDAKKCAELIGIDIDEIYFSGFSSQGGGACFNGQYRYKKGALKAIKEHAPKDTELHNIARQLQNEQSKNFYSLSAHAKHSGHYYHSGCMRVNTYDSRYGYETGNETIIQLLREFADWIYSKLDKEYDYLNSAESVDEMIKANEYEFTEEGGIYE